jgi:hypothetical protein
LEESEHVCGGLSRVVVSGGFGEGNSVWELINGESISDAKGAWNVTFMATVIFRGRTNIPTVNAVGCHVVALVRRDMDNDACTCRCQGALVEVKNPMDACVGREVGLAARGTEEVQGDVCLGHKQIPFH